MPATIITKTITSGRYTFPMPRRERDRLLHSMTPDARAWFYDRETAAHMYLDGLNEAEEADVAYERQKVAKNGEGRGQMLPRSSEKVSANQKLTRTRIDLKK